MAELMEIYNNVKSPLDDDALVNKLIKEYIKSSRRFFIGQNKTGAGLYDAITTLGKEQDDTNIKNEDKEKFYIDLYNEWKKNVIALSPEQIEKIHGRGRTKYNKLQEELKKIKIKNYKDVLKLKDDQLISERIWENENPGWIEIKSREISVYQENAMNIQHIIYLGLRNKDIFYFMNLFVKECLNAEIPFYFKISKQLKRKDKVVIYSSIEYLTDYIDILRKIAKSNKDIIKSMLPPPKLVGLIDGWIGIGDEPLVEGTITRSYYGIRAELIEDAIETATIETIEKYRGSKMKFFDEMITFNSLFLKECNRYITEKLEFQRNRILYEDTEKFKNDFGIAVSEIGTDKFNKYLLKGLKNNIQKGLDRLKEVQDEKNTMLSINNQPIFSIDTRNGKGIYISINDMDRIVKRMIFVINKIDKDFINTVREHIKIELKKENIDIDKFVFLDDTKTKFELMDKSRAMLQGIKKESNIVKKEEESQIEIIDEKRELKKEILEIKDIKAELIKEIDVDFLNKQYITPFGDIVDGETYIRDYVFEVIPENKKIILINDEEISAKQFIENIVFKLINKQFRGDLDLLLEKTTKKQVQIEINDELKSLLKEENKFEKEENVEDLLGNIFKRKNKEEENEKEIFEENNNINEEKEVEYSENIKKQDEKFEQEDNEEKNIEDNENIENFEQEDISEEIVENVHNNEIKENNEKAESIKELLKLMEEVKTLKDTKKRLKQQLRHTRYILNSKYDANV